MRKGSKQSEEAKKKISETLKGHGASEDTRRKLSVAMQGKTPSEETISKMSKAAKNRPSNRKGKSKYPDIDKNHAVYCKCGCGNSIQIKEYHRRYGIPEYISGHNYYLNKPFLIKKGNNMTDKKHSIETRKKMSEKMKGKSPWNKGLKNCYTKECIEKRNKRMSNTMRLKWQNPIYRQKQLQAIISGGNMLKPNKPELQLQSLLNELYPKDWEYVGDGKVILNGFCPDFINVNGKKQIIELYVDYWHSRKDAIGRDKYRIECYKRLGYDTLIIWEKELKNIDRVKEKLMNFVEIIRIGG